MGLCGRGFSSGPSVFSPEMFFVLAQGVDPRFEDFLILPDLLQAGLPFFQRLQLPSVHDVEGVGRERGEIWFGRVELVVVVMVGFGWHGIGVGGIGP